MAYTTINKSTDYFSADLWSGNSSTQSINVGKNFSSNGSLIWIKGRNGSGRSHRLLDSVRGKENLLASNSTDAQFTESGDGVASYSSTGFNLQFSSQNDYNESGGNYVGWNWLAGSSPTGSANTDGSITSTVSVNTTAGFSVVKYTGNGSDQTVGHGLGVAPSMIIVKCLTTTHDWVVYHKSMGNDKAIALNLTNAEYSATAWQSTSPTNQVFYIKGGANSVSQSGDFVAYCFAEKTGYSKFGSYVGNGNADGSFIYTGFKPAFYIIKGTGNRSWVIKDNKRPGYNVNGSYLLAEDSQAEATGSGNLASDELSNGLKIKGTSTALNGSGETYIYMSFAEAPLVGSNNVPCTAK